MQFWLGDKMQNKMHGTVTTSNAKYISGTLTFCIDGEWSYGASYTDICRGWGSSDISMCECHTLNDLVLSSVGKYMC